MRTICWGNWTTEGLLGRTGGLRGAVGRDGQSRMPRAGPLRAHLAIFSAGAGVRVSARNRGGNGSKLHNNNNDLQQHQTPDHVFEVRLR